MHGQSIIGWDESTIPIFRTNYHIDVEKGLILGLAIDLYYEIDITKEAAIANAYSLYPDFEKHHVDPQNILKTTVYKDDKLYFLAFKQGKFGILDTITKELDYVSDSITIEEYDRWPELKEIQVSDDKVYVLASDNVLHIFQKEE